jgi:isochorismate hydrolase
MNELDALILAGVFAVTWGAIAVGFGLDIRNAQNIAELRIQFQTLVNLLGEKIARVLHSPHTPELDRLLEKFYGNGLKKEEYQELMDILHDIQSNVTLLRPKEERLMAAMMEIMLKHDDRYKDYNA